MKVKSFLAAIVYSVFCLPVFGQATDPSAVCAEKFIPGSTIYSRCLAGDKDLLPKWENHSREDRIFGRQTASSIESIRSTRGPGYLGFYCDGRELSVIIEFPSAFSHNKSKAKIAYKFDTESAGISDFDAMEGGKSGSMSNREEIAKFTERSRKSKLLIVRPMSSPPDNTEIVELDFNMEDFAKDGWPHVANCGSKN